MCRKSYLHDAVLVPVQRGGAAARARVPQLDQGVLAPARDQALPGVPLGPAHVAAVACGGIRVKVRDNDFPIRAGPNLH